MAIPVNPAEAHPLRHVEDVEIDLLLEGVYRFFGDDFRGYDRALLKPRLLDLMRDCGLATLSGLQERVLHDEAARTALLRTLLMQPAAMFGDTGRFLALRALAGPLLGSYATPRVWLAECASVEEVFSMAVLLEEEGIYDRTQLYVTSSNETALREMKEGSFSRERLREYEKNYRLSGGRRTLADYCFDAGGQAIFQPRLQDNITWAQYCLATDTSFNEFQLIVCRKGHDFGPALRRRAVSLFNDSLARFGVLNMDAASELESVPFSVNYKPISQEQGLYRRIC